MTLYINTTEAGNIKLALKQGQEVLAEKKVKSLRQEAEKLLPAVHDLLKAKKINLKQIKKIEVENRGGSFTSLRIGVITANALSYSLGIPVSESQKPARSNATGGREAKSQKFSIIKPLYDREPEITEKKARNS